VRAATELAGRKFGPRTIVALYYDERAFASGRLDA
jgi:hypothetical protein